MADWKLSPKIHSLARDLGLKAGEQPVPAILNACRKRVRAFLREFPNVSTLTELLDVAANKLRTRFEEIHSDADLAALVEKYLARGEKSFAVLGQELGADVFGITLKLTNRKAWEPAYVSVIDCRGSRSAMAYFTKWHELGHLLILTDQLRLEFRRTHLHSDDRDPEERLVDVLAGEFGFFSDLVKPHSKGMISFEKIESIRSLLCPNASQQATLIGIARAWPTPCILIRAEEALRKHEQRNSIQSSFAFAELPQPVLRAVKSSPNEAAREAGLIIFPNMRVPDDSVIAGVFKAGTGGCVQIEDLDSWASSDGTTLDSCRVRIEARWARDGVDALVAPISSQN
jgi:hypothetical protein